jgi:hypothetical protein
VEYQGKLRDILVRDAPPKFIDGTLTVPLEKVFNWYEIQEAHLLIESNTIMGKIVCRVTQRTFIGYSDVNWLTAVGFSAALQPW